MVKIKTSKAPRVGFLFSHPAHLIACGFGSGLSPVAPGTVGTLFAWVTFLPLRAGFGDLSLLAILVAAYVVGIFAVHRTGLDLGEPDHGSIVWDEVVPFWLVLYFSPAGWLWQAAAFFLFRFFDIVKPQPARYFDQHMKNGFGVMADDLVAGLYTALVLAAARHFLPGL